MYIYVYSSMAYLLLLTGLIITWTGVSVAKPLYTPGKFQYATCSETSGIVTCKALDISKERRKKPSKWPPGPYALPMTKYGCPESITRGWTKGVIDGGDKKLKFCVKLKRDQTLDNGSWFPGNYSIYMSGNTCPEGFKNFEQTLNISKLNVYGYVPTFKTSRDSENEGFGYMTLTLCERNATNVTEDTQQTSGNRMLETFFMLEKKNNSDCPTINGTSTAEVASPDDYEHKYCLNIPDLNYRMFEEGNELENVALGKRAYQPDSDPRGTADKAVDGGLSQIVRKGSCSHTRDVRNATWEVDLGGTYAIDHVTIYNRADCCVQRLRRVQLLIGKTNTDYKLHGYHEGVVNTTHTFQLKHAFGQWVRITRNSSLYQRLTLCEVQVFRRLTLERRLLSVFHLSKGKFPNSELLSDFVISEQSFPDSESQIWNVKVTNQTQVDSSTWISQEIDIVWYQFDMLRSLSVSKVELVGFGRDKTSEMAKFWKCYYDDVMWSFLNFDALTCHVETNHNSDLLELYFRNVEGRFLTLVFQDGKGYKTTIHEKSVRIFVTNLETLNGELCNEDLGMKDGSIQDFQISASSRHAKNLPSAARPGNTGWCADKSDDSPWILIDLIVVTSVEGVSIWNKVKYRESDEIWSFNLYYGTEMEHLNIYNETTFNVHLEKPRSKVQTIMIPKPLKARYVKLAVWIGILAKKRCLSLELHGCKLSGVPSLNCYNTSEMFGLTTQIRTPERVVSKENSSGDNCGDLCLRSDKCSVTSYSKEGYCVQYMSSPQGIWQVDESAPGSASARLCAKDPVHLFPSVSDYDGLVTTSNMQYIETTTIIATIGYPFSTGSGQEYKWQLNFPEQHYITLVFTNVSLGSKPELRTPGKHPSCDNLFISKETKMETNGKTIDHMFNGRIFVVETGDSLLFLTFTSCPSDKVITSRFRAVVSEKEIPSCLSIDSNKTWTQERNEICKEPKMMLTSMSILNIPFENEERWNIYAGQHNSIQLEFLDFYVKCQEISGIFSIFKIVDFPDDRQYCNTDMPPETLHSKTSNVTIIFQKYDYPNLKMMRKEGFRLQYSTRSHSFENLTDVTETPSEFKTTANKVCSETFKKCYYVVSSKMSWLHAASTCWKSNTDLVSILSKNEQQYIHFLLRDIRYLELSKNTKRGNKGSAFAAHIGLIRVKDKHRRKNYVWYNNSPVTFSAWSPRNPSKDDCTRTNFKHFNTDNTWESEDCSKKSTQYFICEEHMGERKAEVWKDEMCGIASLEKRSRPNINVTYSGKTCQYWNNLTNDARLNYKDRFSDHSLLNTTSNFCKLSSFGMLWCYATDSSKLWEPCFIVESFAEVKEGNDEFVSNVSTDQFECDNGTIIPAVYRCDGIFNCLDLTDELLCPDIVKDHLLVTTENKSDSQKLPPHLKMGTYYLCGSNEWISVISKCDGVIDCLDASDEVNCTRSPGECKENEFSCADGSCIHASLVCDFISDCANSNDEICEFRPCSFEEHMCDNKQCIPNLKRCNGIPDCIDKSDELFCASCAKGSFHCDGNKCIQQRLTCDRLPDCDDGSDEKSCHLDTQSSCDKWWELGYRASGQYIIDGIAVNCDFSSVSTVGGTVKMTIRNTDVAFDYNMDGTLYTRSLFLTEDGNKFIRLIYRDNYECMLEVKSSCHLSETEASVSDDPNGSFVFPHCHCHVSEFKTEKHTYVENRLIWDSSSSQIRLINQNLTDYNFKKLTFQHCNGSAVSSHIAQTDMYYKLSNIRRFKVNRRILNDEIPVEITAGPITCSYEYTPSEQKDVFSCKEDGMVIPKSMLCVYDVDAAGYTVGCRSGSHLQNCGTFPCPKNTVKCPDSYCIPLRFVCDSSVHCPRGDDEIDCFCTDSGRDILIITEDTSHDSDSKLATTMLARQFYTNGSIIRILHYKANRRQVERISLDILEIREEYVNPFEAFNRMQECRYKTMTANVLPSIQFSSKSPKGIVFIEDSEKSSQIAELMLSDISNPVFTIYRVTRNITSLYHTYNRYRHVKDVHLNKWSSLSSIGYKRFPEICKAGLQVPCSGAYRCLSSKQCIPLEQVCDGIAQCINADDERLCDFKCPPKCKCDGKVISCRSVGFNESDIRALPSNTRSVDISQNPEIHNVLRHHNLTFPFMLKLDISFCEIKTVNSAAFLHLSNLRSLDLGYNKIVELPDNMFNNLHHLSHLYLDGNVELEVISPSAFHGLSSIRLLRISGTKLKRISAFTFSGLTLQTIDISNNRIERIEDYAFNNISVRIIDFTDNNVVSFNRSMFNDVTSLQELHTPAFKFCCIRPCYVAENNCFPKKNEFSSCEDLMRHPVLQATLWIVGVASLLGNFGSIMYRLQYDREKLKIGYGIFVTNLAAADFLMGVYLIMIATVDSLYRNRYIFMDDQWRTSNWCVIAGILSTISSEASVFFVCLITLDRFLVIKYPFGTIRFRPKKAYICCSISWAVSITFALIPVLFTNYFENRFYSRSGVCIALPLTRDKPPGWMYSVAIFVGLNFFTFILVAIGQVSIFLELRKARSGIQKKLTSRRRDLRVARNLILVATTDFLCWFPIGVMGIMALNGHPISGDVYAWTAVFILPLNSALNPVLYTFLAIIGKQSSKPTQKNRVDKDCRK